MTIEERAQEFYNSFFDTANIHLMDVAEGIQQPNKAEIEEYGDSMKHYSEDTACEAIQGYGMLSESMGAYSGVLRQTQRGGPES